jgi:hypothetical protein
MVDNLADYTLDTRIGRVFIFPFEYGPTMIEIKTHIPRVASDKISATGLEYNHRKYEVVLMARARAYSENWNVFVHNINNMDYPNVSDPEPLKEMFIAEMSAREYFCGYFEEVIKKWVKDHPDQMLTAQKSQDAQAKTNRRWQIEKLQCQIKAIEDEIARIDAGEHLPNFSDMAEENEDD